MERCLCQKHLYETIRNRLSIPISIKKKERSKIESKHNLHPSSILNPQSQRRTDIVSFRYVLKVPLPPPPNYADYSRIR